MAFYLLLAESERFEILQQRLFEIDNSLGIESTQLLPDLTTDLLEFLPELLHLFLALKVGENMPIAICIKIAMKRTLNL